MSFDPHGALAFGVKNPVLVVAATVLALVVLAIMWRVGRGLSRALRKSLKDTPPEEVLTFIVAALATAGAAQGNFNFFGDKLAMPAWMQATTFAMFELGMLTCALRGRRKIRNPEIGKAGIDGALVWVISAISAVLAATDANGWGVLARLVFPFFAASMWELLLAFERRRVNRSTINWKITPEKLLVRLGLADPAARSVGEVDTHRRLNVAAVATYRLHVLKETSAWPWRIDRARRRQNAAMQDLMASTDFANNRSLQDELRTMVAILKSAGTLADVSEPPPWERPDPVTVMFEEARFRFAPSIAAAPPIGTGRQPELGAGTGIDTDSAEPPVDRYEDESDTGAGTSTESGRTDGDTGTDGDDAGTGDGGTDPKDRDPDPPKGRRRTRRRTEIRTRPKTGREDVRAEQIRRARTLNTEHMQAHGRPISGDKLAAELHVSKTTALDLLRQVKQLRKVDPDEGVA